MNEINPTSPYNPNRSNAELQMFWLFCLITAGRNADWASSVVSQLVRKAPEDTGVIDWLNSQPNALHNTLVANKVGQYGRLTRAVSESADVDLPMASVRDLEAIHGVGPKTARFFILNTREGARHAVLDVHILRWLREHNVDAPLATPQSRRIYDRLEFVALHLMASYYPHLTPAQADLLIWSRMSGRFEDTELPQ